MSEIKITKACSKCAVEKPLEDFGRQAKSKDGRKYRCRNCDALANMERYKNNKKKIIAQVKNWQAANPVLLSGYQKKYQKKIKSV